jgi:probable F420-dependent oxidoreductase
VHVHPFHSRRYLDEVVRPNVAAGAAKAGRDANAVKLACPVFTIVGDSEEERLEWRQRARFQIAFYGSTPAYRVMLEHHGWGHLQPELNAMSKQGRWDAMTDLIDDAILDAVAVVRPRHEVARALRERLAGIADGVSLTNNRAPDPTHWADVVAELKANP